MWEAYADVEREQRLAGASLLVFANKTDVEGCMDEKEILSVSYPPNTVMGDILRYRWMVEGLTTGRHWS